MADIIYDSSQFCLPPCFLPGEDEKLMDKENFHRNGVDSGLWANKLFFPSDFPYGVDSAVDTVSDEEDSLAELTRHLACSTLHQAQKLLSPSKKTWVLSGSPQSTLSALRSPNNGRSQKSSPPMTPLGSNDDAWDVIFAAAGEVARMKKGGGGLNTSSHHYQQNRALYGCSGDLSSLPVKKPISGLYSSSQIRAHNALQTNQQFQNPGLGHEMKHQGSCIWGRQAKEADLIFQQNRIAQRQIQNRRKLSVGYENGRCGRPLGLPQSGWPPLRLQQQQQNRPGSDSAMRAFFLNRGESTGGKRESTGTGVFLPRRYGNVSESRKRSGCSTALLPARVVHALNLNFEEMNNAPAEARFRNGSVPDYDALIARRNELLVEQQKRNSEIRLPQEWTY